MARANKVQRRQKELSRDYMKLYKKLDMYGQAPDAPLSHPWQRDIVRLQNRWETVKSYARVYRNYERAVREFNVTYYQQFDMPTPHTRIDTRTLETLRAQYEAFKKERAKIKRKVNQQNREEDLILQHLRDILQTAYDYSQPSHHTASGEQTARQQIVGMRARHFENFWAQHIPPKNTAERYEFIKRVKNNWESFVEALEKFIYSSDEEVVRECWALITAILTGDGATVTDIEYIAEEEFLYE